MFYKYIVGRLTGFVQISLLFIYLRKVSISRNLQSLEENINIYILNDCSISIGENTHTFWGELQSWWVK